VSRPAVWEAVCLGLLSGRQRMSRGEGYDPGDRSLWVAVCVCACFWLAVWVYKSVGVGACSPSGFVCGRLLSGWLCVWAPALWVAICVGACSPGGSMCGRLLSGWLYVWAPALRVTSMSAPHLLGWLRVGACLLGTAMMLRPPLHIWLSHLDLCLVARGPNRHCAQLSQLVFLWGPTCCPP